MNYLNLPLDTHDLVCLLKARGLAFSNELKAKKQLLSVDYFKLAVYLRVFEADIISHKYVSGATFDHVLELYAFDRELHALIFRAMQDVEIALRSRMIHNIRRKETQKSSVSGRNCDLPFVWLNGKYFVS